MKKIFIGLSVLIVISALQAQLPPQQEKLATPAFTKAEMENLWSIVDESATPGAIRKPLLQKIEMAYTTAFAPPPKPLPKNEVKQDTTKPKPKKN